MFGFEKYLQEIEELAQEYEKSSAEYRELEEEKQRFEAQKKELFAHFGAKYGNVRASEMRNYSEAELLKLRTELANNAGLLALIKSMFGFGKSQKESYRELMGKLNGLLNYMTAQLRSCENVKKSVRSRLQEISQVYCREYRQAENYSGCAADASWAEYEMPMGLEKEEIYLGNVLREVPGEDFKKLLSGGPDQEPLFVGCRDNGRFMLPWNFSLSGPVSVCIDYQPDMAETAGKMLQAVIYQILRNAPQYYMEFHFMDAVSSGEDFKDFIPLQRVRGNDLAMLNQKVTKGTYRLARTYLKAEDISHGLAELNQRATVVINEKAQYMTVTEYNRELGADDWIPYQLVVAQNLQEGFSEADLRILQFLMENGNNLGVFVILLNNTGRWDSQTYSGRKNSLESCFSPEVLQRICRISLAQPECHLAEDGKSQPFWPWQAGGVHAEFIGQAVKSLNSEKKLDNRFEKHMDMNGQWGSMDSTDGIRIPFAISTRGEMMDYVLGQNMNAHGLICGGTGSGKSTLLHMLISSIVLNYSPEDVELWLVDYKITEFSSYKTNTPPHIRFIGLSKSSDFSYAFLDKIVNEMDRRQRMITEADQHHKEAGGKDNITSFTDYRKMNGCTSMRRLVVIIDEFHVMSQHAQLEMEYKTKLENILSEARALGISMVFSDQAIVDGLRGLSDKGKKQIKARIALSNYKDELKETLNVDNMEQLRSYVHMKTGEVAIQTVRENEDREEVADIQRGIGIWIDSACRFQLNEKARRLYHAEDYCPYIFDDRESENINTEGIADWEKKNLPARRDGRRDLHIYIGKPVNLDFALHFPLLQRKGNNIMSVSGTEEQQMRLLSAVVQSFSRQKDYEIQILADPFAGLFREYEPEICRMAEQDEQIRITTELGGVCREVRRLLKIMENRGNPRRYLVIWLGLDSMADLLAEAQEQSRGENGSFGGNGANGPKSLDSLNLEPEEPLDSARLQEEMAQLEKMMFPDEEGKTEAPAEQEPEDDSLMDDFAALFGDDDFQNEPSEDSAGTEAPPSEEDGEYDAREDIARLIHMGPVSNIFHFVLYDSALALKDFREVKTSDFAHRIAFPMSEYEAGEFLDQPRLIRDLAEHLGFYYNGRKGQRFIPYRLS